METTFISELWQGIQSFLGSINWLFVVVFIVVMWLLNEGADSEHKLTSWLNWLQAIPKKWRVFLGGILLALVFAFFYDLRTKADIAGLLYSVLVGMIVWKLGLNNVFEWFKNKVWLGNRPAPPPSN